MHIHVSVDTLSGTLFFKTFNRDGFLKDSTPQVTGFGVKTTHDETKLSISVKTDQISNIVEIGQKLDSVGQNISIQILVFLEES